MLRRLEKAVLIPKVRAQFGRRHGLDARAFHQRRQTRIQGRVGVERAFDGKGEPVGQHGARRVVESAVRRLAERLDVRQDLVQIALPREMGHPRRPVVAHLGVQDDRLAALGRHLHQRIGLEPLARPFPEGFPVRRRHDAVFGQDLLQPHGGERPETAQRHARELLGLLGREPRDGGGIAVRARQQVRGIDGREGLGGVGKGELMAGLAREIDRDLAVEGVDALHRAEPPGLVEEHRARTADQQKFEPAEGLGGGMFGKPGGFEEGADVAVLPGLGQQFAAKEAERAVVFAAGGAEAQQPQQPVAIGGFHKRVFHHLQIVRRGGRLAGRLQGAHFLEQRVDGDRARLQRREKLRLLLGNGSGVDRNLGHGENSLLRRHSAIDKWIE